MDYKTASIYVKGVEIVVWGEEERIYNLVNRLTGHHDFHVAVETTILLASNSHPGRSKYSGNKGTIYVRPSDVDAIIVWSSTS